MSINRLYKSTILISRLTAYPTGHKEGYETIYTDIPCAIQPAGREETPLADGAYFKLFKLYCDRDVDIQIGDQIADQNDTVYQVKGVSDYAFGNESNNHLIVTIVQPL